MGILVMTREPVFKQRKKISKEPIYPMFLKEIQIVDSLKLDTI